MRYRKGGTRQKNAHAARLNVCAIVRAVYVLCTFCFLPLVLLVLRNSLICSHACFTLTFFSFTFCFIPRISTQKGGAGKTTLTVLVASYLHYVKGYNVAVVDCDFPQYSIHDMRKRDMKAVMEDGHYKVLAYEQLKRLKKNPYTIRCSRAEDAVKTAENLVAAQPDLDFVFFDLPGTINNADVVQTISQMDYIFTPIIADRVVMESSIKFATVINEQMISTGKSGIKGIYLVWNMVDGREKTELYKAYDKVCAEFALPILETHLPDSKRFRKETAAERKAVFRSTAFPADKILVRGSNLDKLVDEILGIIKN